MTQPSTDHVLAVNNIEVIYNKVVRRSTRTSCWGARACRT